MITVKDLFKIKATKSTELNQQYYTRLNNYMYLLMDDSRKAGPQWNIGKDLLNPLRSELDIDNGEEGWA